METVIFEKLKNVIRLTINKKLKTNADDTLYEKLYSFIELQTFSSEQRMSLLQIIEDSLNANQLDMNEKVDLTVVFRIYGIIFHDELLTQNLKSTNLIIEQSSDIFVNRNFSLQYSYLKCLNCIALHTNGLRWVLTLNLESESCKTLPSVIFVFLNENQSHFVQREASKLLVSLLKGSVSLSSDVTKHLSHSCIQFISNLTPHVMKVIKEILHSQNYANEMTDKYHMTKLLKHDLDLCIKEKPQNVWQLCELLGMSIKCKDSADSIIQKLIQFNQLKALIGFLTYIIKYDSNFGSKLIIYAVYPLIVKCENRGELSNEFLATAKERSFVEKYTNKEIIEYSFRQIMDTDLDYLNDKHLQLMCESISLHIKENINKFDSKKIISQAFVVLEKFASRPFDDITNSLITVYTDLLVYVNGKHKGTVFRGLRVMCENEYSEFYNIGIRQKITQEIENILRDFKDHDDWELIDSALEILYNLSSKDDSLFTSTFPSIVGTLLHCWSECNGDESMHERRSGFVVFLVHFDLLLPEDELIKFGFKKFNDIPCLLISLLSDSDETFRKSVISALNSKDYTYNLLAENPELFFDKLCVVLCNHLLTELNDDLQCQIISNLQNVFVKIQETLGFTDALKTLFMAGYFHALLNLLNCDLTVSRVISNGYDTLKELRIQFESMQLSEYKVFCMLNSVAENKTENNIKLPDLIGFLFNHKVDDVYYDRDHYILDDIIISSEIDSHVTIDCY